ncbi:MAG: glycoside hydrolase family 31 protein, partial [Muribaculaceae bacterium]|nr:glycoside hydrolase family 31 protein [Muribaculaceae bacterium]
PSIVRVNKTPKGASSQKESMVVIKTPEEVKTEEYSEAGKKIARSTDLTVAVDTYSGAVTFSNNAGELLLTDYSTSFTPEEHNGVKYTRMRESFMLDEGEPVYGIGQVMDGRMNRRNSSYHLQHENMFTDSPYFMSPTKGYGVYLDNYSISEFSDNNQFMEFSQLGDDCDYYFIYGGTPDGVIAGVRDLTGHAPMLPLWAYGYFQSKERYATQQESLDVLKKYREIGVPVDVIIQDWRYWPQCNGVDSLWNSQTFDENNFPEPKKWIDEIHKNNAKLLIVTWPGFGGNTPQYKELAATGHILNFDTWPPYSGAKPYDPYSDEARDIFWHYANKGLFSYIGNDGWWLDSTEPDHINKKDEDYDVMTAAGPYRGVKNTYSLTHNKGLAEHQKATTRDKRVVILTRSGHIGQQRYGSNTWSGDVDSDWDVLTNHIPAALNFTLMGIPNWNSDIGGFVAQKWVNGGGTKNPGFQDLYNRWAQFGAFSPMMRSHGTDLPREIWQFGEPGDPIYESIAKTIRLRYRLLPYIYSTSWDVSANDGTFMRPLVMDYSDDSATYDLGNEYLFGRNILVAPVTRPDVTEWDVYLPKGNDWWDFWTNEKLSGGKTVSKDIPMDIIPLYIKAGTILPFGPEVQYSGQKKWNDIEIRIYPGADGSFTLYEDEFDNYNYEDGAFSTITFNWNDADRTLTIGNREGDYKGMLKNRKFRVAIVDGDSPSGHLPAKKTKAVSYSGKETKIKL